MKNIKKFVFGFMSVLVVTQYFIPVISYASELTSEDNFTLVDFKQNDAIEQQDKKVQVDLKAKINQSTTQEQKVEISFNTNAIIKEAKLLPKNEGISYTTSKNKIVMKISPGSTGNLEFQVTFDRDSLRDETQLQVNYLNQQLTTALQLPTEEMSSESEESTTVTSTSSISSTSEMDTTETTSTSTTDSETTTTASSSTSETTTSSTSETASSTTEDTTEKSESETQAANAKTKEERADKPQDIRDILSQAGISPATIIDGAKVIYLDKDGNPYPDPNNVPINAAVSIDYTWSIPEEVLDQLAAGDYFDFKLPDGIAVVPGSGKLGEYGTYRVNEDGTVHFEFNEKVETDHDINGTFHYDAKFDKKLVPGDVTITTPTEENFPSSEVHIRPDYDQAIDKAGHFDKTPNPDKVIWEVNINRPLNEMTNATVTEHLPEGTSYESVAIYPETVDENGKITSIDKANPLVEGKDYTVDSSGNIKFIGEYAKTSQAFHIVYTTKIDEDKKPEEDGGKVTFKNTATLNDGKSETDASAKVTAEYKPAIKKSAPISSGQDQIYNWSIEYNYNEKKHPAGSYVSDTMGDNLTLVDKSVVLHQVMFKDGKPVQGAALVEGVDYKVVPDPSNPHKFKIQFLKDIDYAVKIEYQTKVSGYVDDPTAIQNSVETDTGNNSSSNGNASQQGIVKNIDGAIDYTNREVPWKIDINNAGYWMENWELEDTFSKGLYLVSDSFQIIDKSDNNRVLNKSEYTLKETATGFQVSFNKPLKDGTDHKFQIKYKTKFDTSAIDGGTGSENDIKFVNDATMTWVDKNGDSHTNHAERPFIPIPEFKYNGSKSGEYNATTKKIQWSVTANYNQQALKNATITDPIQAGQNYVSGSGKLYEAIINKDGSYTLGNEVANAAITEPSGSTNRVTVKLPEGSKKAYVFVFETSLEGEIIDKKTYDNTATFENNGISHDLDASVTVAHAGELIAKDGIQDPDDSNYVNWHVTINSQQATLKNVIVTDEPSANQYVTASDVKVYGPTVSKDGTITEDKNTVLKEGTDYNLVIQTDTQTGKQTIEVHFLNEISRPYMIDYRALITSDKSNDVATNSAHLTGENDKVIHGDIEVDVPVVNHDGSATGSKGSVQIQKEDTEGKALAGAHFQLWTIKDGKKSVLFREGTTDVSGKLKIGNLRVQDYLLIETKAPDGYTISDELAQGKVITITADSDDSSYPIVKLVNETSKVLLHKVGETVENGKTVQNPLAGAEFKVTNRSGKTIKGYEKIVSDKDGLVTIEKLLPGDYYLVETKAPNNYIVETQKIAFTVTKEDDGEIPTIELND
ncbi:MAG: collagen binding domain-containing protein, partial [Enterococcus sp.]